MIARFPDSSKFRARVLVGLLIATAMVVACRQTPTGNSGMMKSVSTWGVFGEKVDGAELIGAETCALCHQDVANSFVHATHSILKVEGGAAEGMISHCEACHGPGSLHMAGGGDVSKIVNPRDNPQACLHCHNDLAGQFKLPHTHPVADGKVSCVDCHDPHGRQTAFSISRAPTVESQACFECHTAQSGPFIFEHEAMREGCETCHDPHGSVNAKMLKIRGPSLCLQCHYADLNNSDVRIGSVSHAGLRYLTEGSCWTAGCHEAVHGSHVNPNFRF